jgi:pimeloyl-ACP methyl ester carboxylesterase
MELLETSVGPVAYDVRGTGDPIVLLPSGGHDHHDYDDLRALLPDRFQSIGIDWPAHGSSPPPRRAASAMAFADVAETVVGSLAPEGAVVMGNSVGGFAAARLAVRRPELVRGLVLVDAGGFQARTPPVRLFCALMARPRVLRAFYPTFSSLYMRARTEADERARATAIATTRDPDGLQAVAGIWRSFVSPEHDLRDAAGTIAAPTLLVWGRRDSVIPLRVGRKLANTIPGAELAVFDTGHVPHTSEPRAVADVLTAFAERAFAGSRGRSAGRGEHVHHA